MKRNDLFFSFLLVPLDYIMIVLAGVSAYYIRYAEFVTNLRPILFDLSFNEYFRALVIVAFIFVVVFAFAGLYVIKSPRKYVKESFKVIEACSTGLMIVVILIFFRRELFDSRFIVLAAWILSIFYVIIARGLIRFLQRYLYKYDIGVKKVVMVGASKTTDNLIHEFSSKKNSGFKVIKRLRDFSFETEQELQNFIENNEADEIIQADPNLTKSELLRLYDFADENHITFKYAADLLGTKVLKTEVTEFAGIPIVEAIRTPLDGWGRITKRTFDILFSLIFIILFSPLLILFYLVVKIDSKGPAIYKNVRVGKTGSSFKLYKFRSMISSLCITDEGDTKNVEYEQDLMNTQNTKEGPVYKIKDDPRITRVGKFIRRWSIDELPQFFNVFFGTMSLVGPRPHQPREVAKYKGHHKKVLTIKPGITGMGQISGRSDLSFEEEVKLDTYYIENWSMLMDMAIILRTPLAILRSRKAE
ncbi:MAG: sugar transferase [Patescibacteria group bacterium]|jgi:exopolysaccharide biosynthesis polyprenyl glycosylphosphotransferase|nr:sugar transferase [Patescibacteria group bacterium]